MNIYYSKNSCLQLTPHERYSHKPYIHPSSSPPVPPASPPISVSVVSSIFASFHLHLVPSFSYPDHMLQNLFLNLLVVLTNLYFPESSTTTPTKQMRVCHPFPLFLLGLFFTPWTRVSSPSLLSCKAAEVFLVCSLHVLLNLFLPHTRLRQESVHFLQLCRVQELSPLILVSLKLIIRGCFSLLPFSTPPPPFIIVFSPIISSRSSLPPSITSPPISVPIILLMLPKICSRFSPHWASSRRYSFSKVNLLFEFPFFPGLSVPFPLPVSTFLLLFLLFFLVFLLFLTFLPLFSF